MRLTPGIRRWLPWLLLALAVLATIAAYWPGRTGGWVFDDYPNIVDNQAIHITRGHATLVAWVNAALSSPASFLHRPLASITFALNWMQGDGDPLPFKLTNIFIHVLNGVLLFCMLRTLLRLFALRGDALRAASAKGTLISPRFRPSPEGRNPVTSPPPVDPQRHGTPDIAPRFRDDEQTQSPPKSSAADAPRVIDAAAATRLALIVSAAWMLLPINLMAVLYVVQRMASLAQVFVLAGLWAYLHGRLMMLTARDARADRRGFALAVGGIVLGAVLGVTSKETAVLLPVYAFFVEWILLRFSRSLAVPAAGSGMTPQEPLIARVKAAIARLDQRVLGLFTFTLFIPGVLGFLWALRRAVGPGAFASRDFTLVQRLLTEPRVLVDYLHWTLFPNPMVLSLYHDEIVKSTGILAPWTTLGAMLLLAALIVVAIALRNRRPLVALGIAWFFAGQLLTATIIPLELVYEQRMYFASIGVLLAAGVLLLGLRWRIVLPFLRGFVVAIVLLWFALATNLRAQEWSNPLRLAIAEADRHPESARAVYEAGRLLLIASNYKPGKALDESWKYLRQASAIPGASSLSDQAMIMIADHDVHGDDGAFWASMIAKLRRQPTSQEDISALISLTNCYGAGICRFDLADLQRAYQAALARPHPKARLDGAYAAFSRDLLHDDLQAETYLARAVAGDPSEPAYRVDLAALYARHGKTELALEQIDALRRMNLAGRLDRQIAILERLAEQGKPAASASSPQP